MKQLLLLLFFLSLTFPILGQNSGDSAAVFTPEFKPGVKYLIKTNIGTVHSGFVVKETKDFITLEYRSTQDRMDIRKSEILSYKVLSQRENKVADVLGENEHADAYIALEVLADVYYQKSQKLAKLDLVRARESLTQSKAFLKSAFEIVQEKFPKNSPHIERIKTKVVQYNEVHEKLI